MSYFHFKSCHGSCASHIKKYLETKHGKVNNRAIETRLYNILDTQYNRGCWDLLMDETRELLYSHKCSSPGKEVTHYHFVLSPSPEDNLSVDDVLDLGELFIKAAFGSDEEGVEGQLGTAQVVMVAHTDSHNKEHPIPHVHIVINNIDLDTGKKIHFSKDDGRWMYNYLQTLCEQRGYHSFSVDEQERKKQREEYRKKNLERGAYITKAERKINKKGNYSWKFDIRNRVRVATVISSTEEEFISNLKKFEVTCTKRDDGDYLYTLDKNPTRWRSTGFKLGPAFVPSAVFSNMSVSRTYNEEIVKNNLIKAFENAITVEAPIEVTINQVVNVLDVSRKYSCWDTRSFEAEIKNLEKKIDESVNESRKAKLQVELTKLKQAQSDSENMNIFIGARPRIIIDRDVSKERSTNIYENQNREEKEERRGLSRKQIAAISRNKARTVNHQKGKVR